MSLNSPVENSSEQQTSRPSSAESNHENQQLHFERNLSNLIDEENKQSNNTQPIIWDDPFELLTTNEQTGRIGISTDALPTSPTNRCISERKKEQDNNLILIYFSIKNINFTNTSSITKTSR